MMASEEHKCYFCLKQMESASEAQDAYCPGCKVYVCAACDEAGVEVEAIHDPEDHKKKKSKEEKKSLYSEEVIGFLSGDLVRVRRVIVECIYDLSFVTPKEFPFTIHTVHRQLLFASKLLEACLSVARMEAKSTEYERALRNLENIKKSCPTSGE